MSEVPLYRACLRRVQPRLGTTLLALLLVSDKPVY